MHSLHKYFEVIITDSAHMAECSICHFLHQTRLTNAPTKTQAVVVHHHRINHTPMYFNGLF
jgi:hypothetical protein